MGFKDREIAKAYYAKWRKENAWRKKKWNLENPEKVKEQNRAAQIKRKSIVINHYGGKCICCGEDELTFLSIDHINGGGTQHRKEVGGGYRFYMWIIRNDFPDNLRVLCHNCNMATAHGRCCPHREKP